MGSFIYSFLFEGAPLTQEGHAHQVHMALFNTLLADTHTYAYTHTHTHYIPAHITVCQSLRVIPARRLSWLEKQVR